VVSPSKTNKSPKKSAKGKEKAVDSDVDLDDEDEGRVPPSRRSPSIRQTILEKDPKALLRRQVEKSKRERQAALSAENPPASEGTEPETSTKSAKKSAPKKAAPKKAAPAATKSSRSATIQNGTITKKAKAKKQPQKSKRKHGRSEYGYETVPSDSEDFGAAKSNTIAKLRDTINRHARWCPFVRIHKKMHNSYRRIRLPEILSDSEDNNEATEPEEVHQEDDDENAEPEDDQSDAESDDGEEDVEPSKKSQSKPAAKKAAPKKGALKKAAAGETATTKASTSKAASSKKAGFEKLDLSKEQVETPVAVEANDGSQSEGSEADASEDENEDEADVAATATAPVSDEELSTLDDDKVEELHEAHEHEQMALDKHATGPSSDKDTGSQKRKSADLESGQGEKESAKKQRRSV